MAGSTGLIGRHGVGWGPELQAVLTGVLSCEGAEEDQGLCQDVCGVWKSISSQDLFL